jgi:hypothetical protein
MIPLSLGLIDLQSTLPLTNGEHNLVAALILLVVYGLIWQIIRFDQWLYLRSFSASKRAGPQEAKKTIPRLAAVKARTVFHHIRLPYPFGPANMLEPNYFSMPVFHEIRATLRKFMKMKG